MKIIKSGTSYRVFEDDNLVVVDKLPTATYAINFDPRAGYSLSQKSNMVLGTNKTYGGRGSKVNKVWKAYNDGFKNLGVILSGNKGIGKSLFARMLAIKAIKNGCPVILVDSPYPGLAEFIDSINQQCLVLFDEFEKNFNKKEGDQDKLLSLFDGISSGKKLFVITCNDLNQLSDFFVNRPGRCHYHFRFDYPNEDAIREFLEDNVTKEKKNLINDVIRFSKRVNLNYDCLQAIAKELKYAESFKDAIEDLNILRLRSDEAHDITVVFKNGRTLKVTKAIDLFKHELDLNLCAGSRQEFEDDILFDISINLENVSFVNDENVLLNTSNFKYCFDEDYYFDDNSKDIPNGTERARLELDKNPPVKVIVYKNNPQKSYGYFTN